MVSSATQGQVSTAASEPDLQGQFPWLNHLALSEVPEPLRRDVETRAVERFFINWTLHPSNDGVSPGHLNDVPMLYLSAPRESVLWFAVRAVAFADMKHEAIGDSPFYIRARQCYGAALSRMIAIAHDNQNLDDDRILAAILLIDNFELMYLARTEPLGHHSEAVKRILHTRGDGQLFNRSHFALWRIAHHRLQSRQILLREEPDPEQIAWMSKLNIDRPDIHISADVLHMNILSAAARKLTQSSGDDGAPALEKLEQARTLLNTMQELITAIDSWTSLTSGAWQPKNTDPQDIAQPPDVSSLTTSPIPRFPCPNVLSYHELWLAYMWNFHAASQIVFRESLIDVINYGATMQGQALDVEDMERIQGERDAIDTLAATIIRSFPPLLGFTHRDSREPNSLPQGRMAGRFFSLFSMWVVQRAQFTSAQHKQTASEVTQWINDSYGLG
ncbi:MAG: hypothetical protein Q9227_008914 [Pyrenula ochraceoflavens]